MFGIIAKECRNCLSWIDGGKCLGVCTEKRNYKDGMPRTTPDWDYCDYFNKIDPDGDDVRPHKIEIHIPKNLKWRFTPVEWDKIKHKAFTGGKKK